MPGEPAQPIRAPNQGSGPDHLTDDLVREVAEKVYALFLQDLRHERERCRLPRLDPRVRGGRGRGGW